MASSFVILVILVRFSAHSHMVTAISCYYLIGQTSNESYVLGSVADWSESCTFSFHKISWFIYRNQDSDMYPFGSFILLSD